MKNRGVISVVIGALALAVAVLPAVALAAGPLPLKHKQYQSGRYSNHVTVSLVTSANGRQIVAGLAPFGSNFAAGGIYVQCPSAPKTVSGVPFTGIPYPAMTLKLSHGKYTFSRTLQVNQLIALSKLKSRVRLTVQFSGTVVSRSVIRGQVKVSGPVCATTASYSARPTNTPVGAGK